MHAGRESLAVRCLRLLARGVYRYPRLFFYPQAVLFIICVLFTVRFLEFRTKRSDMVGADHQYHRNLLAYHRDFIAQDELVAVVESEAPEKNRQFVERLGARLLAETNLFTDVMFNNDVKMLGNKALLFFPEPNLRELGQTLRDYRPFLEQFAQASNLDSLFRLVNQRFRRAGRETNAENASLVQALPALRRIVEQATDSLSRPGTPPSPGLVALFDAREEAERRIYVTFDHGRLYLVTARAPREEANKPAVLRMRQLVEETRREVPGVNVGITGEPVLEYDEMAQAKADSTVAALVSLVLVLLIFIYGYDESGRPIKATICLVAGLAYTMAFTTGLVGHLNILTITFAPMLIGLAIDFGVHLVSRYEEELRHGKTEAEAIEKAMVFTGQGIFTGAFTTAGAFLAMVLTDFQGLREMGIICGGGLLICLIPMMTLLPVLILRGRQNVLDHQRAALVDARARIERLWLERPWTVVILSGACCLAAWSYALQVRFDYNLLNLQSRDLLAVHYERKLIASAEKSVLFCAVLTDSLPHALELEAVLTNLPSVSGVESMAKYLTEDQTEKLGLIREIKRELASLQFAPPDRGPVDLLELGRTLWSLQGYLGLAAVEVEKVGEEELLGELRSLRRAIGRLRQGMLAGVRSQNAAKLAAFQQALLDDVQGTFAALLSQDDRERMRVEDLPPALRHRFVSRSGDRYLVMVYPKRDVWQREYQEEFVRQVRQSLDPGRTGKPVITGTPVQLLEYTTLLRISYEQASWYALGAIALLVWLHFRSLACVVLSLIPVGVGMLWMIGVMGIRGIDFNLANVMTLPLVIGVGVTSGIHILNRFAEEKSPGILAKSTGKAVLVSALTTIVGFGSLIPAKHQGIAGLGYIMAVGTTTCMVAALTLLPAILRLLVARGWQLRRDKKPSDETGSSRHWVGRNRG